MNCWTPKDVEDTFLLFASLMIVALLLVLEIAFKQQLSTFAQVAGYAALARMFGTVVPSVKNFVASFKRREDAKTP